MRKLFSFVMTVMLVVAIPISSSALDMSSVKITGFDEKIDYTALILECLDDGDEYAMAVGAIYEQQRNLKIRTLKLDYEETDYFNQYKTADEIKEAMTKQTYSADDLELLSRLVMAEAGCNWFPDWVQRATASVVINRMNSSEFPNSIREVIYQEGQYGPAWSGAIDNTPTQKVVDNCRYVLEYGSTCPENVLYQSGSQLGVVYASYYDSVLNTTEYFCYG